VTTSTKPSKSLKPPNSIDNSVVFRNPKTKTLIFTGKTRVVVTPTGCEQCAHVPANSAVSVSALQMALQIDPSGLIEAIERLSPEERAAVLRALGAKATQ
jgi:hypothetical protein